jgi:hypothetical protein
LVNGDNLSSVNLSSPATVLSSVGNYDLTGSAAVFGHGSASNYIIAYATVTNGLTVTQRALAGTAVIGGIDKTYDAKTAAGAGSLDLAGGGNNIVNGDTVTLTSTGGTYDSINAGARTVSGLTGLASGNSNYALGTLTATGTGTIAQRGITVTANAQSRAEGADNPPLTYVIGGLGLVGGDLLSGGLATSANGVSGLGNYPITRGSLAGSRNYALTYVGANLTVTPANTSIPLTFAGTPVRPPNNPSTVNFTLPLPSNPVALTGFTRTASNLNPNTNVAKTDALTRIATNPDPTVTGGLGNPFPPSADGRVYKPISQFDPSQYASNTLPDHVDQAGLATILTMIARADGRELNPPLDPPYIDQFFDPAKGGTDWNGIGWQNPLAGKVAFAPEPHAAEPGIDTAQPLDDKVDLGALLGKGPVILGNADSTSWLLAVAITEDGIVADDPVTGTRVLLSYDSATKAIGPIGKVFDAANGKWIALGDAGKAGMPSVDDTRVATLQAFTANKYLTVTLVN